MRNQEVTSSTESSKRDLNRRSEVARRLSRVLTRSLGYDIWTSLFIGQVGTTIILSEGEIVAEKAQAALLDSMQNEESHREEYGWTIVQIRQFWAAMAVAGGLVETGRELHPLAVEIRKSLGSVPFEEALQMGRIVRLAIAAAEYLEAWKKIAKLKSRRAIGGCEHFIMKVDAETPHVSFICQDENYALLPSRLRRQLEFSKHRTAA